MDQNGELLAAVGIHLAGFIYPHAFGCIYSVWHAIISAIL